MSTKCQELLLALLGNGHRGLHGQDGSCPPSPLLPGHTLQAPGSPAVTKGKGGSFPLPEAEQWEWALTASSVFPWPCPDPVPNQRVTKAFKPHTWGEVSQNPSTVLFYFENSQTWTGRAWGSQLPAAFWQQHGWPPLQPLSLLPTSLLAAAVVSPPTHHAVPSFPVQIRGPVLPSAAVRAQASAVHAQCCEMRGLPETDSALFSTFQPGVEVNIKLRAGRDLTTRSSDPLLSIAFHCTDRKLTPKALSNSPHTSHLTR